MRRKGNRTRLSALCLGAILSLSLMFSGSCAPRTVVLTESERVYQVKDGAPVFDGQPHEWSAVEGWFIIPPGYLMQYLKWLAAEEAKRNEAIVPDGE